MASKLDKCAIVTSVSSPNYVSVYYRKIDKYLVLKISSRLIALDAFSILAALLFSSLCMAGKLIQPPLLSSSKTPPKIIPSLIPLSQYPYVVGSVILVPVGFFDTLKWNCPCSLTSLDALSKTALKGSESCE